MAREAGDGGGAGAGGEGDEECVSGVNAVHSNVLSANVFAV